MGEHFARYVIERRASPRDDILTEIAHRRGIAGTVINGINRDTHLCLSLGYPVFSIDHWMRTGKDRVQVEATQVPVDFPGIRLTARAA